jgi:hypothetical protein
MTAVAASSTPNSPQPVKVLLVEDNPGDVRLIAELLIGIPGSIPVEGR